MDGRQLQQQYKNYISDYKDWGQREHATQWKLFEKNMGTHLSIDETALSNDELYTVVTDQVKFIKKDPYKSIPTSIIP